MEVLGDGQTGQTDTSAGSWGLVHLTVHKGRLGSLGTGLGRALGDLDHSGLLHLGVQVITLTGTLSDSGEHRETTMVRRNILDQLHNNDSLTDTGTSEETNLTTLRVRGKKIENLHTSHENLGGLTLVRQRRSLGVDRPLGFGVDRSTLINRLTDHIHDTAESGRSDRHLDKSA